MSRKVNITFDREIGGRWPFHASTYVEGQLLGASGPDEAVALENLKRVVNEWVPEPLAHEYPKVVEVDW